MGLLVDGVSHWAKVVKGGGRRIAAFLERSFLVILHCSPLYPVCRPEAFQVAPFWSLQSGRSCFERGAGWGIWSYLHHGVRKN